MAESQSKQKWIVRDRDGKIYGPFFTSQVLEQIDRGFFVGGEQVALYPGGDWISISKSPQFYDRLLDALAAEGRPLQKKIQKGKKTETPPSSDAQAQDPANQQPESASHQQKSMSGALSTPPIEVSVTAQPTMTPTPTAQSIQAGEERESTSSKIRQPEPTLRGRVEQNTDEALDAEPSPSSMKYPITLMLAGAIMMAAVAFWPARHRIGDGRIHLLLPRKTTEDMADDRSKDKFRRAYLAFQKDTYSNYLRSENEMVEILEGAPDLPETQTKRAEWLALLCLTYRELWPFAYQDSTDLKTLSTVLQQAKRLDPGGSNGATCEIVHDLLRGQIAQAEELTNSRLGEEGQTAILFEIRGGLFSEKHDDASAINYFSQAHVLWPAWERISIENARAHVQLLKFPEAIDLYHQVLTDVPDHPIAKVELAILELEQFSHVDAALELLQSALNGPEKLPRPIESSADFALAQIYQGKQLNDKALNYARKAFALNPANAKAQVLIVRLGGQPTKKGATQGSELIYVGDQFQRAGDCFAAQAQFKAAYEADKRNAVAAMKAGRCLWDLNQTTEAIEWLRKAILADPNLTEAYVQISDYYAQRFDYVAAVQILQKAQRLQPNNYEVYRGFAAVELHRQNYASAVNFANRALKLYETDQATFLVMARAELGLKNYQEASRFASKALELDSTNTEAQALNGKIIAGLSGVDAGAEYIQKLLAKFVITRGQEIPIAAIDLRVALGEIYLLDERYKQAAEAFRQAISLDPNCKKALIGLGRALEAQGELPSALESFLQAAVLDPSDADAIYSSGQLYADVGKLAEASKQFQRVLKINPRYPRAHIQLGRLDLRQGNAKAALDEAMQERGLNPEISDTYELAAQSYFALKQYSACAGEYQKAARHDRSSSVLIQMARCYRLSGSLDSAQSLLHQAQAMESGNPDLFKEQGAIYHMKGMADEAMTAYSTYLKLAPNAPDRAQIEQMIQKINSGDLTFPTN